MHEKEICNVANKTRTQLIQEYNTTTRSTVGSWQENYHQVKGLINAELGLVDSGDLLPTSYFLPPTSYFLLPTSYLPTRSAQAGSRRLMVGVCLGSPSAVTTW